MRIDIISVLPKLIESPFNASILKRAIDKKLIEVNFHDLKDYASSKRRQVDDYQFGGGSGMVMMIEPIKKCIDSLKKERKYEEVIYMTPDGEMLNQKISNKLSLKGNTVYNLPPFTPSSLIMESIEHDAPDCVFVSVTLDENLLSAKRMVEKINEKYGLSIFVGGTAIKNNSENWDIPIGKNLSIPKILKLIQSKKLQILTTA